MVGFSQKRFSLFSSEHLLPSYLFLPFLSPPSLFFLTLCPDWPWLDVLLSSCISLPGVGNIGILRVELVSSTLWTGLRSGEESKWVWNSLWWDLVSMDNFAFHHYSAWKLKRPQQPQMALGRAENAVLQCVCLAALSWRLVLSSGVRQEVSSLLCWDLEPQFYQHMDGLPSPCWWQQVRPVAQSGWFSRTWSHSLKHNTDGGLVLGLWNLYEVAFYLTVWIGSALGLWNQWGRLPFTCMNWFLFLSLAEVRGDFLNPASVALLCHLLCCYWWLGKSALECAGDGTYGAGDPFIQSLGIFFFFFGTMRKKSEWKFSRSMINFKDKTFSEAGQVFASCALLPGFQGTKGREIGILKIISFHFSIP